MRGDAILFANTSAEHPGTYRFTRECKRLLEREFGLPFFWFEFCTVEDASRGQYARRPAYRLVRSVPVEHDPCGYRHRGEVFEEMLAYQGMLPNPHSRSCTAKLKLQPSHQLLAEWLGRTDGPSHAGHFGNRQYVTHANALANYRKNGGSESDARYLSRIKHLSERPVSRPAQRWSDYTDAPVAPASGAAAPVRMWGPDAALHVTLLGLRADEDKRINRVLARSMFAEGARRSRCAVRNQPAGERPSFPLADWGYDAAAVGRFWAARPFDLDVPRDTGNCVFCFMKGTGTLRAVAEATDPERVAGDPSDIGWWDRIEKTYARVVPAREGDGTTRFGFFGVRGPTFAEIAGGADGGSTRYARGVPACDCTD